MTQHAESTWTVDLTMSEEESKSNLFNRPENNMWKRIFCFQIYIFKLQQTSVVTVAGWKEKSGSGGRRSCSDISGTYVYFFGDIQ